MTAGGRDLPPVDLALLLTLSALLRERNVTRAATELGISQPAMSARLARLRSIFDDRLFVPATAGRGVVPTPRAERMAAELEAALRALGAMADGGTTFAPETTRRVFAVAMNDNPAAMLAPTLLARFVAAAPQARVALVLPDPSTLAADLESGRIDIVVSGRRPVAEGWIGRPLIDERFVTAQRRGHPRGGAPLDLDAFCGLKHLLISGDGGGFSGVVDEALAALGRRRHVVASVQSYALAPLVVEASDLVCTLPERLLARYAGTLDLLAPPLPLEAFQLSAHWHPRQQEDPGHRWFRELLLQSARAADRA